MAVVVAGQITGYGGKCVDVAAANSANGTAIQLYDCNGTAAQQWTVGSDQSLACAGQVHGRDRGRYGQRYAGSAV